MKNLVDSIKKRRGAATEVAGAWGSSNCFFIDHRAVGLDREFTNPSTRGVFECAKQAPIDFFDADVAGIGRQHEADFAGFAVIEPLLDHQDFRSWQNGFKRTPRLAFGRGTHDGWVLQASVHDSSPKVSAK